MRNDPLALRRSRLVRFFLKVECILPFELLLGSGVFDQGHVAIVCSILIAWTGSLIEERYLLLESRRAKLRLLSLGTVIPVFIGTGELFYFKQNGLLNVPILSYGITATMLVVGAALLVIRICLGLLETEVPKIVATTPNEVSDR